jgi:hypothetical protein
MNNKRTFFISLTILAVTLACAIPAIPGAQTALPLPPTVDTNLLSTMVAETVAAAVALTEQAVPTATIAPTETVESTPTVTPTAEIVPSGSTLTVNEDGSTIFVDERAGFEVTIPTGWLAVRIQQQEYRDALSLTPDIQKALTDIQNNDPNTFRLFALDTQDGHFLNSSFPNVNFVWDEFDVVLVENKDALDARANLLATTVQGLEVLSTEFSKTSNNVLIGLIESKSTVDGVVIFQKQAIFNAKAGTMTLTISTVEELKDETFSAFNSILETIKMSVE